MWATAWHSRVCHWFRTIARQTHRTPRSRTQTHRHRHRRTTEIAAIGIMSTHFSGNAADTKQYTAREAVTVRFGFTLRGPETLRPAQFSLISTLLLSKFRSPPQSALVKDPQQIADQQNHQHCSKPYACASTGPPTAVAVISAAHPENQH